MMTLTSALPEKEPKKIRRKRRKINNIYVQGDYDVDINVIIPLHMNKKSKNKVDNRPPKHLRTLKRGDKRKDGMIFLCYHGHAPNGERWVTRREFNRRYNKDLQRMRSTDNRPPKHLRTLKRGDIREDSMIFFRYNPTGINGEQWVTKEEFESRKEVVNKATRKYYKNNPDKIKDGVNRRRQNPIQKLVDSQRARVCKAIKQINKSDKTMNLIGCSAIELKNYLESLFADGMSWDNYGYEGWHCDHIRPCASFDLNDPKQQKECFHYTNLQPLWAKDNLSKGSYYNPQTED